MSLEKEPQNTLTRRFTDAEWRVLRELRVSLPNIFAEAFPLKQDAIETPVTIWGVKIDPLNPFDARTSVVLMQFLRSENLSVPSAWDRLRDTLRWRDRVDIERAMIEFPAGNRHSVLLGYDKEGRRVILAPEQRFEEKSLSTEGVKDIDELRRKKISTLERHKLQFDYETSDEWIVISDFRSLPDRMFGLQKLPKIDPIIQEVEDEIRRYYLISIHTFIIINAPSWFVNVSNTLASAARLRSIGKYIVVGRNEKDIHHTLESIIENPVPDVSSKIDELIMKKKSISERIYEWLR
ncbi:hypothetical protein BDQ17DRAFT_1352622 [Cyathus striatus]|nr:hypothetical protein BDQ17DRAFT_1352622 [Cyathus striatus]